MRVKKIISALLMLLCFSISVFSQNLQYSGNLGSKLTFINETLQYIGSFGKKKISYKYCINQEGPFSYISNFDSNSRWLFLHSNEISFVYRDKESDPFFYGVNQQLMPSLELIVFPEDIDATSFLVEGDTHFTPSNLSNISLAKPWVEGVAGDGIGEKVIFESPTLIGRLIFSNGYVSVIKPYLYEYNNRVKGLRITDQLDPLFEKLVILEDTPNPQIINFNTKKVRKLVLEITDVYKGTQWDDTCINFILMEL